MNFKTKPRIVALIVILLIGGGVSLHFWKMGRNDSKSSAADSEQLYTCGMHPQVIQNKPGNCPICGMKLTPIRKQSTADQNARHASDKEETRKVKFYKSTMMPGEISLTPRKDSMGMDMVSVYEDGAADSSSISIDPVTVQNMGIRTELVRKGPVRGIIRTVATIDYNETTLTDITTKFKGWVTKLYVDATGKQVHRGDPLFEVYSPDLYTAQTEYLLALENKFSISSDTEELKESALTKLIYFDISDDQIADLEYTRKVKKTLHINSPLDAIVVEKMVVEGQMVEPGMKLYRLADLSIVWVQAQIYEKDLAFVKPGEEAVVSLSYLSDRKFRGRVTYIYPTVDEKTRTARVRMEFHNPGYFLKPGMFATAELQTELAHSGILVPDSAVLRSGEKNTVFVALEGGHFEPRVITLGPRSENNMYQVLSGLTEGERVVTSGQFMLDSESQLREAIQKMLKPNLPGKDEDAIPHDAKHVPHDINSIESSSSELSTYICPMPEHTSIQYQQPGKCPICGMTLAPVTKDQLSKIQPGASVEYYTCPMPEHADVRMEKPGKCPRCGMTLIPIMKQSPAPDSEMPAKGHEH